MIIILKSNFENSSKKLIEIKKKARNDKKSKSIFKDNSFILTKLALNETKTNTVNDNINNIKNNSNDNNNSEKNNGISIDSNKKENNINEEDKINSRFNKALLRARKMQQNKNEENINSSINKSEKVVKLAKQLEDNMRKKENDNNKIIIEQNEINNNINVEEEQKSLEQNIINKKKPEKKTFDDFE